MEYFCPKCGRKMVQRNGKRGTFFGCPAFFPQSERNPNGYEAGESQCKSMVFPKTEKVVSRNKRPNIVGSSQQKAIWDAIIRGKTHIVVKALAGTGKTTTIEVAAYDVKNKRQGGFAFNKKIEREMTARLPPETGAYTFHGFGLKTVNAAGKVEVDRYKVDNILTKILPEDIDENKVWKIRHSIKRLVSLCKNRLMEPTEENLDWICERYGIDPNGEKDLVYETVPTVLKLCKEQKKRVDFDDMTWFPVIFNLPCEQFDIMYVDEAQDLNPCRIELAFKACRNGRMIVVGDENQAIYGFTGADTAAMSTLYKRLDGSDRGVEVYPLTKTRRCPKLIVENAKQFVPEFEALPEAPMGEIGETNLEDAINNIKEGDMVQCRNNAPLAQIVWKLLRRNLKVQIAGKQFGEGLLALIKRMRAKNVEQLIENLEKHRQKEIIKCEKKRNAEQAIANLNDEVDTVVALTEGCDTIKAINEKIQSIFADFDETGAPKNAVLLTTSHRAKGLEAEHVWILNPALYPSKYAKQDWELQQERNLMYVRDTRSKNTLTYILVG